MKRNILTGLGALAFLLGLVALTFAVNSIPLKPDSAYDAPCTVFGYPSRGMSCGKITAPSGKVDIVGDLNVTGSVVSGGSTTGSNPLQVSSAIVTYGLTGSTATFSGAVQTGSLTVSSITDTGAASVTGLVAAGSVTVSGTASHVGTLTMSGGTAYLVSGTSITAGLFVGQLSGTSGSFSSTLSVNDELTPYGRSSTQIGALSPTAPYKFVFNTTVYAWCVSSGTGRGAWVLPRSTDTVTALSPCY